MAETTPLMVHSNARRLKRFPLSDLGYTIVDGTRLSCVWSGLPEP